MIVHGVGLVLLSNQFRFEAGNSFSIYSCLREFIPLWACSWDEGMLGFHTEFGSFYYIKWII